MTRLEEIAAAGSREHAGYVANPNPNLTHRFKPGQSGNPGGSTRGVERMFREELAALAGTDPADKLSGVRALVKRAWQIAQEGEDKDSLTAIKFLTERAVGMPKQQLEISEGPPPEREIDWSQVPLEERKLLLGALARIEALTATTHADTEH